MTLSPEEVAALRKHFRANDPELVLVSYKDHTALFQLQDCDGYRIGRLLFSEVSALCLSTQWEPYGDLQIYAAQEIPAEFSWLSESLPHGHLLVVLESAMDEEDSALPLIGGRRRGFLLCGSLVFQSETDPGRGRLSPTGQLRQDIESGIREGRSFLSLRLVLQEFAHRGGTRDEAKLVLQELRSSAASEEIEDLILELLDIVEGFIRQELSIW